MRPEPSQALAVTLTRLREDRGMTQEDLAFAAEISVGAISRIERGVTDPHWTTVERLAEALSIRAAELVRTAEVE